MEAEKLKTFDDLMETLKDDERLELIDGEIVKRPMARFEHGHVQGNLMQEIGELRKQSNYGGWWIATEISVRYNEHQTPSHDLAGWKKERITHKPKGVVTIPPDWVCEIISPGHVAKDTVQILNILKNNKVPYYWILDPEEKTVTVYQYSGDSYKLLESIQVQSKVRLEPFPEIEFDLGFIFGD